ncbi:hypothetical protein BH20ACI3_BH20ACI3_20270 [soil metagenome]
MLGNPLVQFCEGQGGNQAMVLCHPQPESTPVYSTEAVRKKTVRAIERH